LATTSAAYKNKINFEHYICLSFAHSKHTYSHSRYKWVKNV